MVEACQNLRQRVRGKRKMVEAKVSRGRKFLRRVGARIAAQQGALNRATAGGGAGMWGSRGFEQRLDEISGIIKST